MAGGLLHVLVLSDDIDATRDFYRELAGLDPGPRPPLEFPGHWLYAGDLACMHVADRAAYRAHASTIGLDVAADAGAPHAGGVDHVSFAGGDYEAALAALADRGLEPVVNRVPGGPRQLFFDDPNGVRVELSFPAREDGATDA